MFHHITHRGDAETNGRPGRRSADL